MRKTIVSVAAVLAISCLAGPANAQTTHDVTVRNFEFDPPTVNAQTGDTVRWTWESGSHTVTSGTPCTPDGMFDSPINSSNTVFTWVVPDLGNTTVPYFCVPHCLGGMTGTIEVTAAPIPTVSEWGLIALGGMLIGAAAVVLRKRQTAAA